MARAKIDWAKRRKASRVFSDFELVDSPCGRIWTGYVNREGIAMIRDGLYRRAAQAACYELWHDKLWPGDRVVASCLDDRCLNGKEHLHVVPKRPYRAPPKQRAAKTGPLPISL